MTEASYTAFLLLGLAMQCRHVRRGDNASLLVAAGCFAICTLTRSTGMAFLPLPLLAAVWDRRVPLRRGATRALGCLAVILFGLGVGMGWTWRVHGHFELGSWTGISLLGKSLVLARPGDLPMLPPALAEQVTDAAATSRALTAAQPDLTARLRAQVQSSSDVRYAVFWPGADADWPAWQATSP